MILPPLLPSCLLSAIAGLSGHLGVFIRGDWDIHAAALASVFVIWPSLLLISLALFASRAIFTWTAAIILSHHGALCLSILVYRYFFHALSQCKGPRMARLVTFWAFRATVVQRKWHLKVQDLHREYGDFVRIKPREISINDPAAVKDVHGLGTKCVKGSFYALNHPHRSLQFTRDKVYHSKRRRLWDRGFTSRAIAGYEPYIQEHCRDLTALIAARTDGVLEVTELIDGFCWDSMGILVFGKSFGMLHGSAPERLNQMKELGRLAVILLSISWVALLFRNVPVLSQETAKWLEWCAEQAERSRHDLFGYLLEDTSSDANSQYKATDRELVYDAELAIGAGSETTSSTVNAIVFLLAKHPDILRKLQDEIDNAVPAGEDLSHAPLIGQPYLDGCINEGLRLYPSVASGVPRETGPEGATIAGVYFPPGITVSTPTYVLQRDPRNFEAPEDFVPERWFSRPEMVIRKEAFNPFSTGAYSCAGKAFAMMEMRLLLATLVRNFAFEFPPGEEAQSLRTVGGGVQDNFTMHIPEYRLIFTRREGTESV
ncbi:hypothetical protein BBP40_005500 [Aspergillus hancockii]|nr:hypothetical protein BBP40_005500 [Aspergillus hancockii]